MNPSYFGYMSPGLTNEGGYLCDLVVADVKSPQRTQFVERLRDTGQGIVGQVNVCMQREVRKINQ